MNAPAQKLAHTIRVIAIPHIPLPVLVAIERGIFARYDLEITAEEAPNSDVLRSKLAGGQADFAHAAVDNAVAMPEGSVVIVMGGESSLNELIAQQEIHSVEDLRGRTLIVDATNTAFALQLKKILLDKGLQSVRDYQLKPVGTTPQRLEAMRQHKEYAASMLGPPTSLLAKHEGFVSLASTQQIIGRYQSTGAFVTRAWAHDHHDELVRYIASYIEAERWLLDPSNRTEITALLSSHWHLTPALADDTYSVITSGHWLQPDAEFDVEGFNTVLKLRAEVEHQWNGQLPAVQKYYEPAYYHEALAKLGAERKNPMPPTASAENARPERTLEEIKAEAIKRAENGMYPLIGLDPADVREAFQSIHSKDKDEWAAAFMAIGDRYMNQAKSLEKSDAEKANAYYVRAWRLYSFGRWPVPTSPGKQRSYEKAIQAFLAHARFWSPPLEIVHIPFENSQITGYLRLPKNAANPVPLVIAINGLDSRKEDLAESFSAILPYGVGYLAIDGPGTGQAPIKVSENADRMLSRVIDYSQSRPEIDSHRLAVHGVSWGAYWATKLAIVERERLRGASAQSPPVDNFFQKEFLMTSLLGNREYLFDQIPAMMSILENVSTLDEMAAFWPKMSLVRQGLLGKPMAPMLIIGGVLDTQVPISDIYLLLSKGDTPKTAWINPQGGHLGRQVKIWPDPVIFKQVIIPWLVNTLAAAPPVG